MFIVIFELYAIAFLSVHEKLATIIENDNFTVFVIIGLDVNFFADNVAMMDDK